ncbi:MAG: YHS domain-containing protein [Chloroflexi bacterium]|nr:YHS domain-containing protein [Chloroflexota bacterium]
MYADTLGRAADATQRTTHFYMYDRMRAAGVSEAEAGAAGETLDPLVEPAILYFFRKGMARSEREDALFHLAGELGLHEHGDVPGQFQAAIVFVDLSSFSPLAEAMGDVTAAEVLQRFASLVRMSAEQHRGRAVKQIGDGFMLVFPDARSAIACSLDIDTKAQEESQFPALRSGVHWGPVLYREGDYVGTTVNLAARLVSVAEPHTVLVTSAVRQATAGLAGLEFVRLGKRRLKGLATEEVLFEVRIEGAVGAEKVLDPVCRMEIGPGEVAARLSLEGEELAFCSDDCLRKFVADPKRYSSAPSPSVASTG